jgi:hypothetical protein
MKIRITESQYRILSEQYSEDELRIKYVDSGLVPENQFNEIISKFNKPFYVGWLLKMVSTGNIKYEDVYKFKHYFNVFEKFKKYFPIKDLGQIKTFDDVVEFERKSKDILIKQQDTEQVDVNNKKNLVSTNDIQKLESVGIKYLGMVDGLQSFQVPPEVKDSEEAWNVYREILGKCSGRDKGQIVSICTMASFGSFKSYLNRPPGSSYYVFYNLGDPKSPYQFHYGSSQFMDKNDDDISESKLFINLNKFLLNKGLSPDEIPYYLKPKLGLKISDFEKKTLKNYDNILTDFVNGSKITFKNNKFVSLKNFYITNDDYNDISVWGNFPEQIQYRRCNINNVSLRNLGFNYISGGYHYILEKLTKLLNEKYPELKINYPSKNEQEYNWVLEG